MQAACASSIKGVQGSLVYWEDGNLTRVLKSLPTDLTDVKGTIVVYGKVGGGRGHQSTYFHE